MTVYRQTMDERVVIEMCDHAGTLVIDRERDMIHCLECQCKWWPVRDWEGGWLGSHTRLASNRESQSDDAT